MNHLVSDLIIRIKNSAIAKRKEVLLPYSKVNKEIGKILVKEGFLEDLKDDASTGRKSLRATIKYERRIPVLTDVEIISKPSLRIYGNIKKINEIKKRGKRRVIISTSKGIMTSEDAEKKGIGGEILFAIW
ncbi:MAG: 30S ribosomal protein S8 [Candidatus Levybacteria bacterium RIFCSPHIGHO2_01_FULL_37_17]|nr:MAG: 30S ribosomal protein S8 [Candidatus Levybacteria bacterium RIFCSPHIGHO2_01_FULL_37_17]OGH37080.1 MAG: 30S ribosomal protein S8 [Candidatus Levybacteria bacterium RIFCSPLOWO2_01_FULL_38_23]